MQGDIHAGRLIRHEARIRKDPTQPNLRQVHLLHSELFRELAEKGMHVDPAQMGENITTAGLNLLVLPAGTLLQFPSGATVTVTGLRNPCVALEAVADGLLAAVVHRREDGQVKRLSGVMLIVTQGGAVRTGDRIRVTLPAAPHQPLLPV